MQGLQKKNKKQKTKKKTSRRGHKKSDFFGLGLGPGMWVSGWYGMKFFSVAIKKI